MNDKAILIIDMPKNCAVCPFVNHEDEGWLYCSVHNNDTAFAFKKPDWCPLIKLPQKKEEVNKVETRNPKTNEYEVTEIIPNKEAIGYNSCIDDIMRGVKT